MEATVLHKPSKSAKVVRLAVLHKTACAHMEWATFFQTSQSNLLEEWNSIYASGMQQMNHLLWTIV